MSSGLLGAAFQDNYPRNGSGKVLPTARFNNNPSSSDLSRDSKTFLLDYSYSLHRWNTSFQLVEALRFDRHYKFVLFSSVKREFQGGQSMFFREVLHFCSDWNCVEADADSACFCDLVQAPGEAVARVDGACSCSALG